MKISYTSMGGGCQGILEQGFLILAVYKLVGKVFLLFVFKMKTESHSFSLDSDWDKTQTGILKCFQVF